MKYSKRILAHLNAAQGYAKLSHAKRLKVGAVLVRDDRVISVGYNGMPSGGSNECEMTRPATEEEKSQYIGSGVNVTAIATKPEVVHAEMNCIAFAAKNGIATEGSTLVITDSPCFECCKLLLQAGVKRVYYDRKYRETNGLDFLRDYELIVEKIKL